MLLESDQITHRSLNNIQHLTSAIRNQSNQPHQ
jgi:hypothetical protein